MTLCESLLCHATKKRAYLSFPLKLALYKQTKLIVKWFIMLDKAGESRMCFQIRPLARKVLNVRRRHQLY